VTLAAQFTSTDLALVIVVLVLICIAGYVALAETALTRMNKVKAMTLAEEQPRRGRALLRLIGHPERFLNPLLLVVLVCQLVQATIVGILSERLFGAIGIVIATVFNIVVVFVLAEAAPKTWALQHPERSALLVARPVAALVAFPPIRMVSRGLIGLTNVVLPGKGLKKGPFVSEEELLAFADVAVEEDVIEHEERELIESIIDFGDTVAREVMIPRLDMVTVPQDMTVSDALDVAIAHGFSRLPVVGTTVDDVKGVSYAKDLMRAEREGRGTEPVKTTMRDAKFIPETKPVARLMREMQAGKFHMALLVDEHGGIAGLVTLEDLIEELVGDIVDEYDVEDAEIEHLENGSYRVQGSVPIDELNDLLESDIPHDDWDTVGGFVLGELGRVPESGESVQHHQWTFTVEEIDGRRVGAVRVTEDPEWEPIDDDEET
jgi:CBS domain containing-hemolysin-like protein